MRRLAEALLCITLILGGCTRAFIKDKGYMDTVHEDFVSRSRILEAAGVSLDDMGLAPDQRQAMEFLYAYMPLGDIVNMSPEYYLRHYHLTLDALESMPWGAKIPEREMRHFVLPVRVNNENLDESRTVFFEELAPRVRNLSMYDAVLEVNHWCHEKAVYMPSDRRTSSPLATVKTAYGRCGEESTLLVAALRSVGIPARQVYTPRWAHTDSNHAWVEAWVDGQWYFLGACEPEPVLNLGWFNAPASRGMLMHTKVFGKYDGPEDVVGRTPIHTEINVITNYAPESADLLVKVTDTEGKATGKLALNAKVLEVKSMDVDKDKRTDKSLAKGSTMLLLSEKMFVGARDSKMKSTQLQVSSDKTGVFAENTLELQQAKAVVQLSGGNAAVGGGSLDLYGKTTLQSDVTAKGAIKGGDIEMKNMKEGKQNEKKNQYCLIDGMDSSCLRFVFLLYRSHPLYRSRRRH